MSTETDPLSEDHRPRFSSPRMDAGASRGWQECARRGQKTIDGLRRACDAFEGAYKASEERNKRLRELLKKLADELTNTNAYFTRYSAQAAVDEARCALEGKE